jgi:hypothetical protein
VAEIDVALGYEVEQGARGEPKRGGDIPRTLPTGGEL